MDIKIKRALIRMLAANIVPLIAFILPFIVSGAVTWILHVYDKPLLFALALVWDVLLFVVFLLVVFFVWLGLGD